MEFITTPRTLGICALGLVILGNAAGNLLLKLGADAARTRVGILGLLNWQTAAGITCFGLAILIYAWVLKHLELHTAQIVVSLQYVAVITLAALLLGERISVTQWFGIALIAVGLFLCTR
jgi:drug/metabolite transporter (DMT)-like permease